MKSIFHRHSQPAVWIVLAACLSLPDCQDAAADQLTADRPTPNVVLIMTDDQGLGDFGCTGNPLIQTPNIDAMYQRSFRCTQFYVSPVCSPTRSSLMTGRYHYRTRVVDTYIGRSMMEPEEVTLAERFQQANYATGIFGKWHLGDCYPMRAMDQGFETAVVLRGGGIGQASDPLGAEGDYTNPILFHNGVATLETGYCTDRYYDHAINFIKTCHDQNRPFFVYLPDNCPHGPFDDVPGKWWDRYRNAGLTADKYPTVPGGQPILESTDPVQNARVYSMISNVDENIGRLQKTLDELGLTNDTIVIFMTDNGPNGERYTCGLRGRKTSVYEGGIRTLFLMQWPDRIATGRTSQSAIGAHIDLVPTLVEACGLPKITPAEHLDGISLMPWINDPSTDGGSPDRPAPLFFQVHRGNVPQRYHHCAIRDGKWKLVHASGFGKEHFTGDPKFELYDLDDDPFETQDLAAQFPDQVTRLKTQYDGWFDDVSQTRPDNFEVPRIEVSPAQEGRLELTRQDIRRDPTANPRDWATTDAWRLISKQPQHATITVHFQKPGTGTVQLTVGEQTYERDCSPAGKSITFESILFPASQFEILATRHESGANPESAYQVHITYPGQKERP